MFGLDQSPGCAFFPFSRLITKTARRSAVHRGTSPKCCWSGRRPRPVFLALCTIDVRSQKEEG